MIKAKKKYFNKYKKTINGFIYYIIIEKIVLI